MARIGNGYRYVLLWVLLCVPAILYGQQSSPTVQATVSQTTLFTGQRIKLTITVSGKFRKVNRPTLPDFPGFSLLNSTPSTSQSFSSINGVTKSSYAYSYYLMPKGKGDYQIPPVKVKVDGKIYKTDSITIHVKSRGAAVHNKSTKKKPNIYLRLNVSDSHPVTGQQIIVNVELYFKRGLQVQSFQPQPGWKAQGFWKESLNVNNSPTVHSTIINGVQFRKARLMQFALFPTESGSLTISPYEVEVNVRKFGRQNNPFGNFFGGFNNSSQQHLNLKTKPITIKVKSLPKTDTSRFTGAVGIFNISRKLNTTKAKVGQSIQVTTTISGSGNLPLINEPKYDYPRGLEVYQPQVKANISRKNHRISGSKTFTDVMVARSPGTFTIPPKKLSYFDPNKHKYITETLPAQTITVEGAPVTASGKNRSSSFTLKPVLGLATWITPESKQPYRYWWLWVGLFIPALVFALAYWQQSYQLKMKTNDAFARSKNAAQKARTRLDEALEYARNSQTKQAYNALQKALMGFISDRLALPEAGLSIAQYVDALEAHNVNKDLIKNVQMLLNKCDTINYAPESSADLLKSHVGLAESIIQKLKKEL
jgi:hypothetical protein